MTPSFRSSELLNFYTKSVCYITICRAPPDDVMGSGCKVLYLIISWPLTKNSYFIHWFDFLPEAQLSLRVQEYFPMGFSLPE